nr:unnamed protein product [Digitaria exilis]
MVKLCLYRMKRSLHHKIMDKVASHSSTGFIHDAWLLSKELIKLGDEKLWEVIRGYLHAKSLGSGGEYLTFVSLLMLHAGLETFPEKQQRVHLRLQGKERVGSI